MKRAINSLFSRRLRDGRGSALLECLRRKADQRRLLLHLDFWDDVIHRRVFVSLRHRRMFKCGGLVGELMGRKRLRVLRLQGEGVLVGKVVMGSESMRIEAMEMGGGRVLTSMYAAFGGG